MRISCVINTAASDPWVHGRNPHRVAGYSSRYDLLTKRVLPAAVEQDFDEVIVVGTFEEGEGYRYLELPPRHRDRRDALAQREHGARHATGDLLVFSHDDHALAPDFVYTLRTKHAGGEWDLLVPRRVHGITGATLNNGFEDAPLKQSYMGGHALVMRRWLWAAVPWTSCDTEYWDTSMTRLWQEAGGRLAFAQDLVHIDVEAEEWES